MTSIVDFKISVRAHSDSVSFKPLAQRLGARVSTVYDKGEAMRSFSGQVLRRTSPDNYLSTEDIELKGITNLKRTIREQIAFIQGEPILWDLTRVSDGEIYVWVAVFGDRPRRTDTLGIDLRLFGYGIGLVIDNFTIWGSRPSEVLEIKPHGA